MDFIRRLRAAVTVAHKAVGMHLKADVPDTVINAAALPKRSSLKMNAEMQA